jgi:PilZ domain
MSSPTATLATEADERRRGPRTDVDEPAYISSHGSSTRCRVVNISAEGAAIDVPDPVFIPARFQLMTEKDRVIRDCRIVWTKQNRIGVVFE